MLNVNLKILSKALTDCIKKYLHILILSDILPVIHFLKLRQVLEQWIFRRHLILLITFFLITTLKKFCFAETFIKWIQILIRNQTNCTINGGTNTKYFKLQKGTRRGDRFLLTYLFLFLYIEENKNIRGINIFNNIFYVLLPMIQHFL